VEDNENPQFTLAGRVAEQLRDARLGILAGALTQERLNALLNNPSAQRLYDTRHDTINVVQEVGGVTLRITVAQNSSRIISVGPVRARSIVNGMASGRFVSL